MLEKVAHAHLCKSLHHVPNWNINLYKALFTSAGEWGGGGVWDDGSVNFSSADGGPSFLFREILKNKTARK
jgi:hypothetical protein